MTTHHRAACAFGRSIRWASVLALLTAALAWRPTARPSYLFMWAGDSAHKASDFLAVIDATPTSPRYGAVLTVLPTGTAGTRPHHTEQEMPADGHLLANGFGAGVTYLFDLTDPLHPRLASSFGDAAAFSHPHTYVRLADNTVLTTFQYGADSSMAHATMTDGMGMGGHHSTGGLVEMDERGRVIRSAHARDSSIADGLIHPYSVLAMPNVDRALSTSTDMDQDDSADTGQWIQVWRLHDLALLRTIALPPGPRGNENQFTGEPRLLPDGHSIYVHTFSCGLYLLRGVETASPSVTFVHGFEGMDCGVPLVDGHYWLQPVPALHGLVSLDISDPEHPRQVSSVSVGDDEKPHWIAIDATGRRIVMNSGGYAKSNRLYILNFDPATGALSIDKGFRDPGSSTPGIDLSNRKWPNGIVATAAPHGTVFSR